MITLATRQDILNLQKQIDQLHIRLKLPKGGFVDVKGVIHDKDPYKLSPKPKKWNPKETRVKVTEAIKDGKIYSVATLVKITKKSSGAVSGMLTRLCAEGKAERVGEGLYRVKDAA